MLLPMRMPLLTMHLKQLVMLLLLPVMQPLRLATRLLPLAKRVRRWILLLQLRLQLQLQHSKCNEVGRLQSRLTSSMLRVRSLLEREASRCEAQ
jgi:hypothetical protein